MADQDIKYILSFGLLTRCRKEHQAHPCLHAHTKIVDMYWQTWQAWVRRVFMLILYPVASPARLYPRLII